VGQDIVVTHEFESPIAQTLLVVLQEYIIGGRRKGEKRIGRNRRRKKTRRKGTGGEDQ
jgi:hypothetical protein